MDVFFTTVLKSYSKKTGENFLYEKYVVDESIEPYTKEEADAWLKRHEAEIEETKKRNKKWLQVRIMSK